RRLRVPPPAGPLGPLPRAVPAPARRATSGVDERERPHAPASSYRVAMMSPTADANPVGERLVTQLDPRRRTRLRHDLRIRPRPLPLAPPDQSRRTRRAERARITRRAVAAVAIVALIATLSIEAASVLYLLYIGLSLFFGLIAFTTLVWSLHAWHTPD